MIQLYCWCTVRYVVCSCCRAAYGSSALRFAAAAVWQCSHAEGRRILKIDLSAQQTKRASLLLLNYATTVRYGTVLLTTARQIGRRSDVIDAWRYMHAYCITLAPEIRYLYTGKKIYTDWLRGNNNMRGAPLYITPGLTLLTLDSTDFKEDGDLMGRIAFGSQQFPHDDVLLLTRTGSNKTHWKTSIIIYTVELLKI